MEPETLEVDSDNYQIPLIIGKLRDTWAYGKEAKRLVSIKEGFTVTRLLSRSLAGDKIEFGEETYDAVWLLSPVYSDVASSRSRRSTGSSSVFRR